MFNNRGGGESIFSQAFSSLMNNLQKDNLDSTNQNPKSISQATMAPLSKLLKHNANNSLQNMILTQNLISQNIPKIVQELVSLHWTGSLTAYRTRWQIRDKTLKYPCKDINLFLL